MTAPRGWALPESHLLPDAVVAFVDGELSLGAQDRAASHIARCPGCAAEVMSQRQACTAVRHAGAPSMSAGFLASLRSIPQTNELPTSPDNLAITADGQLVAIQRPDRVAGLRDSGVLGGSARLGSSTPLGSSHNVLGSSRFGGARRRAAQGAGVVVSGLVLSALALVATTADVSDEPPGNANLLPAQFGGQPAAGLSTSQVMPTLSPSSTPVPAGLVGMR
jgi:anti-sigma factor RsiW